MDNSEILDLCYFLYLLWMVLNCLKIG